MKLLLKILISSLLVMTITYFFPSIAHVDGFKSAVIVAIVLGLLNLFVKPILVIFTLPITVLSLGFFLLVINAAIIAICSKLVEGFSINGFFGALFFSIILSLSQSILYKVMSESK